MDAKENLLDIYSDGGEWEDFEPVIDQILSESAALRAENARLREALEKIAAGDGVYGQQAGEYKEIARAALRGEQ